MPRYAASRTLPAPVEAVWEVLADPARWPEWWPGLEGVEPAVRRALAPGAVWQLSGSGRVSLLRRPPSGMLLVLEVVPLERVAFQLTADGVEAVLELEPAEGDAETVARLTLVAPWLAGVRRSFAARALDALAALVRPAPLLP